MVVSTIGVQGKFPVKGGWVFVVDKFHVYNGARLATAARKALSVRHCACKVTLYEGVPGAGKTHAILEEFKPGDVILGATRATVEDVRKEMVSKHGTTCDAARRVRTIDSYLLKPNVGAGRVFVDEALMVHVGALRAAIRLIGATDVYLYGDRQQIPFIQRYHDMTLRWGAIDQYDEVVKMMVSWRCPVDVAVALLPDYDGAIRTRKDVVESMSRLVVSNIHDIKKRADVVYLTFRQDEKMLLRQKGFQKVMTIHEAQGKTFQKVALVRASPNTYNIYDSAPHCLVAISRHTQEFCYFTCGDRVDGVTRYIARASNLAQRQLVQVNA